MSAPRSNRVEVNGWVILDKPVGMTSTQGVAVVKRVFNAKKAGHALHVLDRFHIVSHLNKAVDEVRRAESTRLRGKPLAAKLKKMRWQLLRRGSRVRGQARIKLHGLLASKMATGRAWDLKEWPRQQNLWVASGSGSLPRV